MIFSIGNKINPISQTKRWLICPIPFPSMLIISFIRVIFIAYSVVSQGVLFLGNLIFQFFAPIFLCKPGKLWACYIWKIKKLKSILFNISDLLWTMLYLFCWNWMVYLMGISFPLWELKQNAKWKGFFGKILFNINVSKI